MPVAGMSNDGAVAKARWIEVAEGVLARRHPELDLTTGLVVGADACLVIDTGVDVGHGDRLAAAIRQVTGAPWQVVLTHGHFDHCFGAAAFRPCPVWAHRRCGDYLHRSAAAQRVEWGSRFPGMATVTPVTPDHAVATHTRLDVGGRRVELHHFGPAHTDHDLIVSVPDVSVVFAGDLVEQGAPLSVDADSDPQRWPAALDGLLALRPQVVVPGHGEPVDAAFVAGQRLRLL